jgi:hypothetical protein
MLDAFFEMLQNEPSSLRIYSNTTPILAALLISFSLVPSGFHIFLSLKYSRDGFFFYLPFMEQPVCPMK